MIVDKGRHSTPAVKAKTKAGNDKECESERQTEVMNTTDKTDLYQSLIPAYHLSKIWGLLPVRFVQQSPGRYWGKLHVPDVVYSVCLILLLMSFTIFGLWRDLHDGWENSTRMKSPTAIVVTFGDVFVILFMAIVSILGAPFRWPQLQNIINHLVEVDEKLGITSPKKPRRYAICLITISLAYLITVACLDFHVWDIRTKMNNQKNDKGPLNYTAMYFLYVIVLLIEAQYTLLTYNIGERFCRLNQTLKNVLRTERITGNYKKDLGLGDFNEHRQFGAFIRMEIRGRPQRKSKVADFIVGYECRNVADTISQLITVHSALCDTVLLINTAFGVPVLMVTLSCLLHLIITPYVLIVGVNGSDNGIFLTVQCLWCVLHIGRMFIIVQPCYRTNTEAKGTAVIVSQLLSWNLDHDVRKQLEIFSLQLLHRPIDFSVCGLFSLNRSLVTSIVGSVTTYLVILIQFQKADDTKDTNDILKNATQLIRNVSTYRNIETLRKST